MLRSKSFWVARAAAVAALAFALAGCASDGGGLDGALGLDGGNGGFGQLANLGLGGPHGGSSGGSASLPATDVFVRRQLERRGL